jgi:hypothetical protein
MRNRRRILVLATLIAIGLAGYLGWRHFFGLPAGVNYRGFELTREGMTQAEVEKILGKRPNIIPVYLDALGRATILPQYESHENLWPEEWFGPGATVWVFFSMDGTVEDKAFHDSSVRFSLLDRIRWWLGW